MDIILKTGDAGVRDSAATAIGAICTRTEDRTPCAQAVMGGLGKATGAPAKSTLLRLLPKMKTDSALGVVRQAVGDADPQVREAAIRALTEWPGMAAAPALLEIARAAPDEKTAVLALRGCVRLAGLKDADAAARLQLLQDVLAQAKRPEEKREALAALGALAAPGAADVLQPYLKDAALASDAAAALVQLGREIGPLHRNRFSALLKEIAAMPGITDALRQGTDEALKGLSNTGQADGYLIGWLMAGPFTREGKDGSALHDEVFDPEKPGMPGVAWKAVTAPARDGPRILPLDRFAGGGDNRVVYLLTQIQTDREGEVTLETGSDDGIKIWLNGQLVHDVNAIRPCTPASEKVKLGLKAGANALLVKVSQGGGQWEACLRLRGADGGEATGLTVGPSLD